MFKQIYAIAKQLLMLTEDMQKNKADIKELRHELKDPTEIVQQLKFEMQRNRENETHEREKLMLRLENALLRFERRLPAGGQENDPQALQK